MKNAPAIQFYPRDYLADADVRMLNYAQRGIYMDLLCYCWERDGLPAEHSSLAKLLGLNRKESNSLLPEVMKLFITTGDGYHHKRLLKQKELYAEKSAKASASALRRHHKSDANALPTHCEGNAIIAVADAVAEEDSSFGEKVQEEGFLPPAPREDLSAGFAEFWTMWPRTDRKEKKKECLAKWKSKRLCRIAGKIHADVAARKKTRKWMDGFEPAPMTYLNGESWTDDEVITSRPTATTHQERTVPVNAPRNEGTPMTPEMIELNRKMDEEDRRERR